jgi:hypothetical protein
LIDDLLSGTVRFDGDRGIIPALVGELLNYPYFQNYPQRTKVLKLIAAFPRGCSREMAKKYGVLQAWQSVFDDLRGDIITELDEGLALVQLQRVGRQVSRLNVLLRRYWMQITDQQLQAEDAPRVFSELVLPLLFPEKVNDLNGWKAIREVQLSVTGGYRGLLEGTSSPRYPLRRIGISVVANQPQPRLAPFDDTDIDFVFQLDFERGAESSIGLLNEADQEAQLRTFEFKIAISRPSQEKLRGTLAWIEHYLSPQPISPALVLSLLRYLKQPAFEKISERDQERRHDTIVRLQEWLLAELFPPELFIQAGYMVLTAGKEAFKEFLYFTSRTRWPTYSTLAIYQHWSTYFNDYLAALKQISPSARIGMEPVTGTKSEIAQLFGLQRHAGFKSRAKQFGNLLKIEQWEGRQAAIYFVPHPAEEQIALKIRKANDARTEKAGSLPKAEVYQSLRTVGFSSAEAKYLLDFACARGMIRQADDTFIMPDVPTAAELVARARALQARCESLANLPHDFRETLEELQTNQQIDPLRLNWQLDEIERRVTEAEAEAEATAREEEKRARAKLLKSLKQLSVTLSSVGSTALTAHLRAVHDRFTDEQQKLKDKAALLLADETCTPTDVDKLIQQISAWSEKQALFERWNSFAQQLTLLLPASGDERGRLDTYPANTMKKSPATALMEEARAILAQQGISALNEISRLEMSLTDLEQESKSIKKERARATIVKHPLGADLVPAGHDIVRKHLVQALSKLPPGPTDLSIFLKSNNGSLSQTDILSDLVQLQKEGVIHMTIEVVDMGKQREEVKL